MMKTILYKMIIAVAIAIASPTASAVLLTVAGEYAVSGTTSADRPELAGFVEDFQAFDYSFNGPGGEVVEGSVLNFVVRSVDGTLDFYWQIRSTGGTGSVSALRAVGFEGYSVDADWRQDDTGTAAPDSVLWGGPDTGSLNFVFDNDSVGPDIFGGFEDSVLFFADTNATEFDLSGSFDLVAEQDPFECNPFVQLCFSGVFNNAFAPSAVPVPAAAWLFGSGLLGLVGVARRKKTL